MTPGYYSVTRRADQMLFTTVTAGLRRVVSVQQKSLKRLPMELVHLSDACIDCIGACRIPQAETLKNPIKQRVKLLRRALNY